tara:strand:+ start:125 stop:262 length:138 start_codon:yes stop_codon:yes gene_type:complete
MQDIILILDDNDIIMEEISEISEIFEDKIPNTLTASNRKTLGLSQ